MLKPIKTSKELSWHEKKPQINAPRALAVADRMNNYYGQAECALNYTSPFTLTIAVLLSAQTTDAGVNKVTPLLFEKYGTPETMAQANVEMSWILFTPLAFIAIRQKIVSPLHR